LNLLLLLLLSFDLIRGPLVAVPGQLESTTGNVCVYSTSSSDGKHKFMLLDFEGAYGGLPRRLQKKWLSRYSHICGEDFRTPNNDGRNVQKNIFLLLVTTKTNFDSIHRIFIYHLSLSLSSSDSFN
jgi:hypothetical protein